MAEAELHSVFGPAPSASGAEINASYQRLLAEDAAEPVSPDHIFAPTPPAGRGSAAGR